jgi:hypothetical protein
MMMGGVVFTSSGHLTNRVLGPVKAGLGVNVLRRWASLADAGEISAGWIMAFRLGAHAALKAARYHRARDNRRSWRWPGERGRARPVVQPAAGSLRALRFVARFDNRLDVGAKSGLASRQLPERLNQLHASGMKIVNAFGVSDEDTLTIAIQQNGHVI